MQNGLTGASLQIKKIEILDQIGKKSHKIFPEKYGVEVSMISDIKIRSPEIRSYKRKAVEMGCQRPVKTMKGKTKS